MAANFELRISLSESNVNIANNTSVVTVSIGVQANNGWHGYSGYQTRIVLSGSVSNTIYISSYNIGTNQYLPLNTTSYTIKHEDNGAKAVSVSAVWYSDGVVGTISSSAKLTLTTIPRTSDITSFPNFDVDGTFSIGVNKKASAFHDDLRIYYGSTVIRYSPSYVSGTNITFNASEKSVIYGLMSTVNSGTFKAEIITYNGSTKIGTTSKNATGSISNANPVFSGFSWASTNHLDLADNQTVIKGFTNIGITIRAAMAQKGSTIKSYKVQCGSKVYTTASISEISNAVPLTGVDDSIIKAYAIDSRGNATEMIQNITKYIEYKPLNLSDVAYDRGDGGIGSTVAINYKGTAWIGSFGLKSNTLSGQYFYKESGSSTWIQGTTVINPSITERFFFSGAIRGDLDALGFDSGKNFDLKIRVTDILSVSEREIILAKGIPQMAFGNGGIAFGGFYDESVGGSLQASGMRVLPMRKDNGYYGFPDIPDYLRTPWYGLIPYQSGGSGTIGTTSWPFNTGFFNNLQVGGVPVNFRFSTSEQFTGQYWIDGKKIYTKTIVYGSKMSGAMQIAHNVANVGDYITIDMTNSYLYSSYNRYSWQAYANTTSYANINSINSAMINLYIGSNWKFDKGVITIRYTKTTD